MRCTELFQKALRGVALSVSEQNVTGPTYGMPSLRQSAHFLATYSTKSYYMFKIGILVLPAS